MEVLSNFNFMKKEEDKNVDINEAEVLAAWDVYLMNTEPKKKKKVVRRKKCTGAKVSVKNPTNIITDQLQVLLGCQKYDNRTIITKKMIKYIKTNNLVDPTNRRRILPNRQLQKLFKIPEGEQLTFFNLQKYLRRHISY